MIHNKPRDVNHRVKICTLRPTNAPHITAGVLYHDPDLGVVLHSIRRDGIHQRSNSIQFDANIMDQAEQRDCQVVEVATGGQTYSATLDTIRTRGRFVNTKFGLQLALALKCWSTNGVTLSDLEQQPTHEQMTMFGGGS
ncbi:MAG: hypothetical protein R2867_19770 [Caldilineaceae bacterium]